MPSDGSSSTPLGRTWVGEPPLAPPCLAPDPGAVLGLGAVRAGPSAQPVGRDRTDRVHAAGPARGGTGRLGPPAARGGWRSVHRGLAAEGHPAQPQGPGGGGRTGGPRARSACGRCRAAQPGRRSRGRGCSQPAASPDAGPQRPGRSGRAPADCRRCAAAPRHTGTPAGALPGRAGCAEAVLGAARSGRGAVPVQRVAGRPAGHTLAECRAARIARLCPAAGPPGRQGASDQPGSDAAGGQGGRPAGTTPAP